MNTLNDLWYLRDKLEEEKQWVTERIMEMIKEQQEEKDGITNNKGLQEKEKHP